MAKYYLLNRWLDHLVNENLSDSRPTMKMSYSPAKRWVFTHNNYTQESELMIQEFITTNCEYGIYGRKVASTGTIHLQGYLYLKKKIRLSGLRYKFPDRVHFERAKGTSEENRLYCTKENDYFEYGIIPSFLSGKRKTRDSTSEEFYNIMDSTSPDIESFARANKSSWLIHGQRALSNYYASKKPIHRPNINAVWIYGPTGIGKSHYAHSKYPNAYQKSPNTKWWHLYRLEKDIIIDDIGKSGVDITYLLLWLDKWPCQVETKGAELPLYAINFIITSNYHPESIYGHTSQYDALLRRLTIFNTQTAADFILIDDFYLLNTLCPDNDIDSQLTELDIEALQELDA